MENQTTLRIPSVWPQKNEMGLASSHGSEGHSVFQRKPHC